MPERNLKTQILVERLSLLYLACFAYRYKSLQLLQKQLSLLKNLLDFIITKYLKQEFDENLLSICVDEDSPCDLPFCNMFP